MQNKFKLEFAMDLDAMRLPKSIIIVGIVLVYLSAIFTQYTKNISIDSILSLTILMMIQLLLFLFSDIIFKHRYWLYFVLQGIIIFAYAVIMPKGYITLFIGLIPILVFQSIIVYYEGIKVIVTSLFFYSIFCGTIIIFNGVKVLIQYILVLLLITIAVRVYAIILFKQVKLRIQIQKVLKELELAYEKVEKLTLINERQRMARELHDTLSQGLVGIIMQLEAVNMNLNNNNIKRAQEIVQKAMEHARKTLSDSRFVINELRFQESTNVDFTKAIENEIAQFKAVSNTSISKKIKLESQIPLNISKHILYIVREALNNIAKHAKAKNAVVEIIETHNQININIADDGIGFDVNILDHQIGHYGILGITERVKAINGEIKINSKRKSGTSLNIIVPIEKGIYEGNE